MEKAIFERRTEDVAHVNAKPQDKVGYIKNVQNKRKRAKIEKAGYVGKRSS